MKPCATSMDPLRDSPVSRVEAGLGPQSTAGDGDTLGPLFLLLGFPKVPLSHPLQPRAWRAPPTPAPAATPMPSRTQGPYCWTQLPLDTASSCKLDLRALPSSANTPLLGPIALSRLRSPKVTLTLGLEEEGGKAASCDHFAKGGGEDGGGGGGAGRTGEDEGPASALNTRSAWKGC